MFDQRILAFALLNAFGTLAQLPPGWFGYENARWTECTNLYSTCTPTISTCADYLCNQCYSLGGSGFKSCCKQPTPYLCFQTAAGENPYVSASPSAVTNPQQLACETAADIVQNCESATSGFDNLVDSVAASCLCYSGTVWQPQSFDQPWSSCIAWASTADTSDFANFNSFNGFCSSVGDVINSPASAAASTTPASQAALTTAATGTTRIAQSSTGPAATSATASKSGARMLKPTGMVLKMLTTFAISIAAGSFVF